MKINLSKATFSSIVGIGQKVKKASLETGEKYIELNRGVNAVVEIDLSQIIPQIDFQSKELQVYAPNLGIESFRKNIIKEYFPSQNQNDISKIAITPGGMPALDIVIQTLNVEDIIFPQFYWGSYSKMATIRNKSFSFYDSLESLDLTKLSDSTCIFICDPNNPTGLKLDDKFLLDKIKEINKTGAIIVFDCPYRKLFKDFTTMDLFDEVSKLENVIITESFSKWVGLSGLRMGFIWCNNKSFNEELNIRLLYEFNGISTASQLIVNKVISSPEGIKAHSDFRKITTENIFNNINFLKEKNLLVDDLYKESTPWGIFAVINRAEDYLFKHKIGAVGLDKFVYHEKDSWSSYSRLCVSVNSNLFKEFINNI